MMHIHSVLNKTNTELQRILQCRGVDGDSSREASYFETPVSISFTPVSCSDDALTNGVDTIQMCSLHREMCVLFRRKQDP